MYKLYPDAHEIQKSVTVEAHNIIVEAHPVAVEFTRLWPKGYGSYGAVEGLSVGQWLQIHFNVEPNPDPHQSGKSDPDAHQS